MSRVFCGFAFMFVANLANGAVIGQWTNSSSSWNLASGAFSTIKNTLTTAGHTIEADGAITSARLAIDDMFVIGDVTRAFTSQETTDMFNWVSSGGILWVGIDSGGTASFHNSILAGLGSTINFSSGVFGIVGNSNPLLSGNFATNYIYDIVGQNLSKTPGKQVFLGSNGTFLSNDLLAYQKIGNGYVFAAGDRFEHNNLNPTASSTNGKLMLNIAAFADVPEPSSIALLGVGIAGIRVFRRKVSK